MAEKKDRNGINGNAVLTPLSDKKGKEVFVCVPEWFDERKDYKITNAPPRTASLEFSGADLNFMARVLYAEAAGSHQLRDKAERGKEKAAIINVKHFRLNRKGYPSHKVIATSFEMVCMAPNQFESVFGATKKYLNSTHSKSKFLSNFECSDLDEAISAIQNFLSQGPDSKYQFDEFRGYNPTGQGTHIGRSRFFLTPGGRKMLEKAL